MRDAAHLSDVGNLLSMPRAVDQQIAFRPLQEKRMRVDCSERYLQFCLPQVREYLFQSLFSFRVWSELAADPGTQALAEVTGVPSETESRRSISTESPNSCVR